MKWNAGKNRRRSEVRMVQKLYKKISVGGVKPVPGLGDWGEAEQRRYTPPLITKSMKKMLKSIKVDFCLVGEYHTSKTCSRGLAGKWKTFFHHGHISLYKTKMGI